MIPPIVKRWTVKQNLIRTFGHFGLISLSSFCTYQVPYTREWPYPNLFVSNITFTICKVCESKSIYKENFWYIWKSARNCQTTHKVIIPIKYILKRRYFSNCTNDYLSIEYYTISLLGYSIFGAPPLFPKPVSAPVNDFVIIHVIKSLLKSF